MGSAKGTSAILLALVVAAFLAVVGAYGDAWLVPWHDEVVLVRLGQNIAAGNGFRNDLLDDLLPGADRRTYWQMPLYPFALSVWGRLVGFELNAVRWFSRLWGALTLLLLFALAKRLRLPEVACLLAMLWSATDLGFQWAANFARPDILTGCLLVLAALLLTISPNFDKRRSLALGLVTALAVFTHPIALPYWAAVGAVIVKRSGWRQGALFAAPLLIGAAGWFAYALTDWATFTAQIQAHWLHKRYPLGDRFTFLLGTTFWGIQHYLGVPVNAFPWIALLLAILWVGKREVWVVPKRLLLLSGVLYCAVTLGAEAWYPPLFVPFGSLLLATFGVHLWHKARTQIARCLLLALALGLWGWQASVVVKHLAAVPVVRKQTTEFVRELLSLLPPDAIALIGSFSPDPTFELLKHRPAMRLYQLMPAPMVHGKALQRLRSQLTHLLVLEEATKDPLLKGHFVKRWQFGFGGLTRPPHEGIAIVLLATQRE